MATTEPIRSKADVKRLAGYYKEKGELRNYTLVVMGVHTALRISDLLRLKWEDVYDFAKKEVKRTITLTEKKTGKTKMIALHKSITRALRLYALNAAQKGVYIFENSHTHKPISRVQAYRLIRAAAEKTEIGRISCHSLRKTFGYHALKKGIPLAVIMDIYNHTSLAVTRRYLGITQDDKNRAYLQFPTLV